MDALLSAVAGDLVARLFSFLIEKYQEPSAATTAVWLQRALLRARVVVEEAEGRQINNRAMLQQLIQLREQLCLAAYTLDAFRWRSRAIVSRSRSRTSSDREVLFVTVDSLEDTLRDMREFIVLLGGCPRINRQPYSTYLFMESCMFGRQLEKEEIISFLSKPSQDLDVFTIIGPHDVGKQTLVEHVCLDERVRERFTRIHRLHSDELDLHIHWSFLFDFRARCLMVIDIVDSDAHVVESWRRFHSAARRRAHSESKIIVISRTEAHSSLGTVPPLRLPALSQEELWYFFKALAFGAANPDEQPDLGRIALALCTCIHDKYMFAAANIIAASMRVNLSVQSWRRLFKVCSEATLLQPEVYYLCGPVKDASGAPCLFYNVRKLTSVVQSELPKVTMLETMLARGSLSPAGLSQFDVLMWQSRIPPYGAYVMTCDMEKARQVVPGQKRACKRRRDSHDGHQRTHI